MGGKREEKLVEVQRQLERDETGSALILLDQVLEMRLRDECLRLGVYDETGVGEKEFSKWTVPNYMRFLGRKGLLTKHQKRDFFELHDWRNSAQHSGLEPKKELVKEALKTLEPFIKHGPFYARALMNAPVIGVQVSQPLSRAVALMKKYDYSQLPVFKKNVPVGSISERTLLDFFEKHGKPPNSNLRLGEITDKPFPMIKEDAPLPDIVKYLRLNHGILVTKEERVTGIITKADLLKLI